MTALDQLMPAPRLVEFDDVELALPSARAWELVRHADLTSSPLVRALFALRTLPSRVIGREREPLRLRIDEFASSEEHPGFQLLVDEPPNELVVGAVGKVWQPDIPFVHVPDATSFAAFSAPGFVRVAWALRLLPKGPERTSLTLELRVDATDAATYRKFRAYFRLIGPASRFIRRSLLAQLARAAEDAESERSTGAQRAHGHRSDLRDVLQGVSGAAIMGATLATPFLRARRSHWGLTSAQANLTYPGDELVGEPLWSFTHAVEIEARSEDVWPWVAQIGADKAGFYSYQWLENIAGCGIENAEAVHPEWEVHQGDDLKLHPKIPPLRVVMVARGRYFVAFGPPDPEKLREGRGWVAASWLFLVDEQGLDHARVISRYRVACAPDFATRLSFGAALMEPIGFAMDRRMLLGLKARVERTARAARPSARAPQHLESRGVP